MHDQVAASYRARVATSLTRQERALLALLATGATDEAAASRLGLSSRTVRRRLRAAMDKLGATSRFQAGYLAGTQDLIEGTEERGGSSLGSSFALWVHGPAS
jgi:DNA-binding NarL/FixJ family response regulator